MAKRKTKIFTATIEHHHGNNHYAAKTKKALYKKLAEYCRGEWQREIGDKLPMPGTDAEVVEAYFEMLSEWGEEFLDMGFDYL